MMLQVESGVLMAGFFCVVVSVALLKNCDLWVRIWHRILKLEFRANHRK